MCREQCYYDGYYYFTAIHSFGILFYQVLFSEDDDHIHDGATVKIRPREPEIPDKAWQLIQWCCTEDPKERPTIDQLVQEMESWISLGQFTSS
ncbi:hypothetical protein M378DRAFT_223385 [Amanita muscaria Koide BX008]|uniref:Serine-threonine/tyrosine-protein kinase catalytic domain-containing protein n=1 Tax=Amanita muscaria (strain Koide BX008) TaxID=946122 RepID=A0A0C2XQN5_AMAMK|nr:hypothetical protein M378DRAFT_223385 [Amanita muscaria Koide BX008]